MRKPAGLGRDDIGQRGRRRREGRVRRVQRVRVGGLDAGRRVHPALDGEGDGDIPQRLGVDLADPPQPSSVTDTGSNGTSGDSGTISAAYGAYSASERSV